MAPKGSLNGTPRSAKSCVILRLTYAGIQKARPEHQASFKPRRDTLHRLLIISHLTTKRTQLYPLSNRGRHRKPPETISDPKPHPRSPRSSHAFGTESQPNRHHPSASFNTSSTLGNLSPFQSYYNTCQSLSLPRWPTLCSKTSGIDIFSSPKPNYPNLPSP